MFALKILFLNFQGWLLFNYQCSFCCLFATACLLYLTCSRLSTTFLFFFFKNFCRFSTAKIIYHNFLCLSTTFKILFCCLSDNSLIITFPLLSVNNFFFKFFNFIFCCFPALEQCKRYFTILVE